MSRWQAWARQLRRQHGRRDAWHARGAMALLQRGGGMAAPVLVTSWRPILQVHARFGVARPVSMPAAMVVRDRREVVVHGAGALLPGSSDPAAPQSVAAIARERSTSPALRFLLPAHALGHGQRGLERLPQQVFAPRLDPAAPRQAASHAAASAAEIVARVHRRAVRQELALPPNPLVLAAPHRPPAQAAAPAAEWTPAHAAAMPWAQGRAPSQAAAVSVEELTGLVVQQIDRRLIAYRERMGRD